VQRARDGNLSWNEASQQDLFGVSKECIVPLGHEEGGQELPTRGESVPRRTVAAAVRAERDVRAEREERAVRLAAAREEARVAAAHAKATTLRRENLEATVRDAEAAMQRGITEADSAESARASAEHRAAKDEREAGMRAREWATRVRVETEQEPEKKYALNTSNTVVAEGERLNFLTPLLRIECELH